MSVTRIATGLLMAVSLIMGACGGKSVTRSCNEHTVYRTATENARVQAPDDLSQLDPEREMVLPEPSPQPSRPADAPCLDLPPSVLASGEAEESEESE